MKKFLTQQPHGRSKVRKISLTILLTAVFLAAVPAWAVPNPYAPYASIVTNQLVKLYGAGTTIAGCTQYELEQGTLAAMKLEPGFTTGFTAAALYGRSDSVAIAPSFAEDLSNNQMVPFKASIGQGAVEVVPSDAGSITSSVLAASGPVIPVSYSNTTFASKLTQGVTGNSTAVGQIAFAIASTYPEILTSNTSAYATDPRITLALTMARLSPGSAEAIAENIGMTIVTSASSLDTNYPEREQLAQFSYYVSKSLLTATVATQFAVGIVQINPEMAPRVVDEMLYANPTLASGASIQTFIQTVAKSINDPEEVVEIATALAFGPGYDSLAPNAPTPAPQLGTQPYVNGVKPWLKASNINMAQTIAAALGNALASQETGEPLSEDLTHTAQLLSNAIAAFGKSSIYQAAIVNLTYNLAKYATSPDSANDIVGNVAAAIRPIFGSSATAAVYTSLAARIGSLPGNTTANALSAISYGLANFSEFAWGPLNTDETPNTNL